MKTQMNRVEITCRALEVKKARLDAEKLIQINAPTRLRRFLLGAMRILQKRVGRMACSNAPFASSASPQFPQKLRRGAARSGGRAAVTPLFITDAISTARWKNR